MNGCSTCGGFGNRHDPIAHDWSRESTPAPDPTPAEQAVIERFGIFAEEEDAR